MWSISETIENGKVLVTANPEIWIIDHILYWPPPDQQIERSDLVAPGPDWVPHMCRILREKIETFEEALEAEQFYSEHRNSADFRKKQAEKLLKRQHPVNHNLNNSGSNLIDFNDMIEKIDAAREASTVVDVHTVAADDQCSTLSKVNYHRQCTSQFSNSKTAIKKPIVNRVTKPIAKAGKKLEANVPKKLPPFQKNYLRKGVLKKREDDNMTETNRPRYDNFLKSGRRSRNLLIGAKNKSSPSATITKDEYSEICGETSDTVTQITQGKTVREDVRSTPLDVLQENEVLSRSDSAINTKDQSKYGSTFKATSCIAEPNIENEYPDLTEINDLRSDVDDIQIDSIRVDLRPKINVLDNILVKDAPTMFPSQPDTGFEDMGKKLLEEFSKAQKSFEERQFLFEARIEKKLDAFFSDQSRMQAPSHSTQSTTHQLQHQERESFNDQHRMQGSSRVPQNRNHPYQREEQQGSSRLAQNRNHPYQREEQQGSSRLAQNRNHPYQREEQHGSSRLAQNRNHPWQREYDPVDDIMPDYDDFEELDQNFPIKQFENVAELEYNIRKDLELNLLMQSRLNELTARDPKKAIRSKMKFLFTDPVLEKYTWRGTIKKRPFKSLKSLNHLIYTSVRYQFKNYRRFEYNSYMVQWLKHAKTRQRKVTYSYPDRKETSDNDESSDDDFVMN